MKQPTNEDIKAYNEAVERAKATLEGEDLEKCLTALYNWITWHERENR